MRTILARCVSCGFLRLRVNGVPIQLPKNAEHLNFNALSVRGVTLLEEGVFICRECIETVTVTRP